MNRWQEDLLVASSGAQPAPEHRFHLLLRREFDLDGPTVKLVFSSPFCDGQSPESEHALWDSCQVELLCALLQEALPALQAAELTLEDDWKRWRDRIPAVAVREFVPGS